MTNIHPSSLVDPHAELGKDVMVGPFCRIGPNVKIGDGTQLLSHVVVEGWTTIGIQNTIFPFSVLGAIPQDLKYKGEKTEVIIGSHNTIRESVTINLGTIQGLAKTVVGDHNLLMAYVHVGHDSIVKNNTILANAVGLAGHVIVEDYANVGGMVGVAQFLTIGLHSYVAGRSSIDRDVPPFCIVVGERPCEIKGANIIGLRRRGYKPDLITSINEAIKLWKGSGKTKEQSLLEIEAQYGTIPDVQHFVDFIRNSKNGCLK